MNNFYFSEKKNKSIVLYFLEILLILVVIFILSGAKEIPTYSRASLTSEEMKTITSKNTKSLPELEMKQLVGKGDNRCARVPPGCASGAGTCIRPWGSCTRCEAILSGYQYCVPANNLICETGGHCASCSNANYGTCLITEGGLECGIWGESGGDPNQCPPVACQSCQTKQM